MPSKTLKRKFTNSFIVKFNGGKQWIKVIVGEEPKTFRRRNNCHAWYAGAEKRKKRSGLFGYIHLPFTEPSPYLSELISHEIQHLILDWVFCHNSFQLSFQNEERIATMTGEINRKVQNSYKNLIQMMIK